MILFCSRNVLRITKLHLTSICMWVSRFFLQLNKLVFIHKVFRKSASSHVGLTHPGAAANLGRVCWYFISSASSIACIAKSWNIKYFSLWQRYIHCCQKTQNKTIREPRTLSHWSKCGNCSLFSFHFLPCTHLQTTQLWLSYSSRLCFFLLKMDVLCSSFCSFVW